MGDMRTSVVVDLAGNLPRQAPRFAQQYSQFAQTGRRQTTLLRSSIAGLGRGLDRLGNKYTALLTGAGAIGAIRGVVDFDAELKQLAVDADITDQRLANVKKQILDIANRPNIRVDADQLLIGIKEITARTGDINVALDNLKNLGLTIRATGAAGEDAGALVANFFEKFQIRDSATMLQVLDESARLGKAGAFELRDLATEGNSVAAAYAATGRVGPTAVREMNTLLQIVRRTTPSAAEASTSFERLIATLTSEKVQQLQEGGIQIWDSKKLAEGVKIARPIPQIIEDILRKTKADPEVLAKIFDVRALRAMNAFALEFRENNALPSVEKFMKVVGDGSQILEDSSRNAKTAKSALQSLKNTFTEFSNEKLSSPIQGLAEKFDQEGQDAAKSMLKTGATIAGVLGGVLLARKLGVGKLFRGRGGAAGGLAGAAGAAAGSPIPVYVVNFGGAGAGSVVGDVGGDGKRRRSARRGRGRLGRFRLPGFLGGKRGGYRPPVGVASPFTGGFTPTRGQRLASFGRNTGGKLLSGAGRVARAGGSLLRGAGRVAAPLAVAGSAIQLASIVTDKNATTGEKLDAGTEVLGGAAGGLAGAKLGAIIGTAILPGIGTAIGGALGGLGGYLLGEFAGDKLGDLFLDNDQPAPQLIPQPALPKTDDRKHDTTLLQNRALTESLERAIGRERTAKVDPISGEIRLVVEGPARVKSISRRNPNIDFETEHLLGTSMGYSG